MMRVVTWLSVVVLGPGSIAIFIWFLMTLKTILGSREETKASTETPDPI